MDRTTATLFRQLDTDLRMEEKQHLWWSNFMSEIEYIESMSNSQVNFKPSGNVIDVATKPNTMQGFGDVMFLPMEMQLSGTGIMGDATLIGNEEPAARKIAAVHYNQIRHATPLQEGEMDLMREEPWNAMELKKGELGYWHAQTKNWNIIHALYLGVSENIYRPTTDATYGQGLGVARRLHPNMYYYLETGASHAGASLTRIGTAGKFPTGAELYSAVKTTVSSAAYGQFNSYTVMKAAIKAKQLGIRQLQNEDGFKFWIWLIHPEQALTLITDSNYVAAQTATDWKSHKDNPMLSGALGYYQGFVFFEDITSVRGFVSTNSSTDVDTSFNILGTVTQYATDAIKQNPRFLPMEGMTTSTTAATSNYVSAILGKGAIGMAKRRDLKFVKELVDYENWQGLGAAQTYGFERMDYVRMDQTSYLESSPSSCTNVYNNSSMLVMTWQ